MAPPLQAQRLRHAGYLAAAGRCVHWLLIPSPLPTKSTTSRAPALTLRRTISRTSVRNSVDWRGDTGRSVRVAGNWQDMLRDVFFNERDDLTRCDLRRRLAAAERSVEFAASPSIPLRTVSTRSASWSVWSLSAVRLVALVLDGHLRLDMLRHSPSRDHPLQHRVQYHPSTEPQQPKEGSTGTAVLWCALR